MDAETLSYAVQRGLITPCAEDAPLPRLQCLPSPDPEDVMQTRLLPFLQQHAEPYQETWTVTPDQRDAIFGLVTKVTRKATLANLDFDVPALPKPMPVLLEEFRFPRRFWKNKAVVPKKWKAPPKLVPIDLAPLEEACLAAEGKLPSIDDLLDLSLTTDAPTLAAVKELVRPFLSKSGSPVFDEIDVPELAAPPPFIRPKLLPPYESPSDAPLQLDAIQMKPLELFSPPRSNAVLLSPRTLNAWDGLPMLDVRSPAQSSQQSFKSLSSIEVPSLAAPLIESPPRLADVNAPRLEKPTDLPAFEMATWGEVDLPEPLATEYLDALVSWDLPVLLHESSEHELLDVDWPVDLDARLLLPQAVPPIDDDLEIPELLPPVSGLGEENMPSLEFREDLPSEFLPAVQSTPETPSQCNAPSVPSPTFEQFLTQRETAIDVTVGRPTFVENAALRHFFSLRGHPTPPPVLVLPDPPKQITAPKPSRSHLPLEPKVEENLPRIKSIASYRLSQMTTLCARLSTFGFDLVDDAGDDTLDLCGPDLVFDIVSGVIFWKMAQLAEHEEALCSLLHAFSGAFANQLLVLELYHATGLAPDSFSPAYQQTFAALKKRLPDQVTVKLSYSPFDSAREARLFADKHRRESWLWTEPRDWLTDEPAETVHRLILETQNLHLFAAQAVLARLPEVKWGTLTREGRAARVAQAWREL